MIETEIWGKNPEKPGYLKLNRIKTIKEVYQELVLELKERGAYEQLDYFLVSFDMKDEGKEFPRYRWISCYAVEGSNEGHYIHVAAVYSAEGSEHWQSEIIFTGKTFMGLEHALEVANICTTAFYR